MYLDSAATTPVRREVLEAMWPYLAGGNDGVFGNPSSRHEIGERAARALADARARLAAELGCRPAEIVLTSGGTEADNLAIKGISLGDLRGRHLVTTPIEHEAVLASADALRRLHGFEVEVLPVGPDGSVDPAVLAATLRPETTLVSIHHANNEIGVVQPVAELAAVAHAAGVPFHTDAVQSAGWLPVGLAHLGVDAVSIAGHKLGAPKGIGVLAVSRSLALEPVMHGGGQERGRRAGTENVAGAVGLATAFGLAPSAESVAGVAAARDTLIAELRARIPSAVLTGPEPATGRRLPNHASFCFPGSNGETVLLELERRGLTASSGSACAAGRDDASHVLLALGIDEQVARTAVRFTLAAGITASDAASVARQTAEAVAAVVALGR